jgi:outer membrane lipoprotein SlyB
MNKEHAIEAVAVGAGIGAAAGAIKGGGKGAGIGAGAGAGVGAIAGLLTDHDLRLEKGTVLEVRLDHPLQIPYR